MANELKTNFSISPYFDDYFNSYVNNEDIPEDLRKTVEDKQYVRILFKPATAVQARELTQMQTMLQRQISRNANYNFRDGAIINGCDINFYDDLDYIRCDDSILQANTGTSYTFSDISEEFVIASFVNGFEVGVRAVPILVVSGQKEEYPDTNIIYLRYISEGEVTETIAGDDTNLIGERKKFVEGDQLKVYNANQGRNTPLDENNYIFSVNVYETQSEDEFSDGVAYAVKVGDGIIYQKGHFLKVNQQVGLVSKFDTFVDKKVIGFNTEEKIVSSEDDETILSNAQGFPNENAPGADRLKLVPALVSKTRDEIDEYVNFFPIVEFSGIQPYQINKGEEGLRRIRDLMATRTSEESGDYAVNPFTVEPVPYNVAFPQAPEDLSKDYFGYKISPGTIYCRGYRVNTINPFKLESRKGIDTKVRENTEFTAIHGKYVIVEELLGTFDFENFSTVIFYDQPSKTITNGNDVDSTPLGWNFGNAKVKALRHISGDRHSPKARYLLYLFDIVIGGESTRSFQDVATIKTVDGAAVQGVCDVVLEEGFTAKGREGIANLKETNKGTLLFETGFESVKTLKPNDNNQTQYRYTEIYDTLLNSVTQTDGSNYFKETGEFEIVKPGNIREVSIDGFDSSGTPLTGISTDVFIFTLSSATETVKKSGVTVDTYVAGNIVEASVGNGFEDVKVGDYIKVFDGAATETKRVVQKNSDNELVVDSPFSSSSGEIRNGEFSIYYPNGYVINNSHIHEVVPIGPVTQIDKIILRTSLGGGLDLLGNVSINAQIPVRATGVSETPKEIQRDKYLKIDCAHVTEGYDNVTDGYFWQLGITDLAKIQAIYVGDNYSEDNPDRLEWFWIDNGQREDHYSYARIGLKDEHKNKISATKNSKMLIKLNYFTDNEQYTPSYYSVDSYPINDGNTAPDEVKTSEIPVFKSDLRNKPIDLRNAIDFRTKKIPLIESLGDTPADAPEITFSIWFLAFIYRQVEGGPEIKYCFRPYTPLCNAGAQVITEEFPTRPINLTINSVSSFEFNVEYYLPRIDHLCVNFKGQFSINEGIPDENPREPTRSENLAIIGSSYVPAYPTLTQREAKELGFEGEKEIVTFEKSIVKRYTMEDISAIEQRIERLEYYTTLNMLEQQANDMTILDENGLDRFKNGIFADNFNSHMLGEVTDIEYKISIDPDHGIARPIFEQDSIDLKLNPTDFTNVYRRGTYITLPFVKEEFISQLYATKVRNCAALNYQWNGTVRLFPDIDFFQDVTNAPVSNVTVNHARALQGFANQINRTFGGWRTVRETENVNRAGRVVTNVRNGDTSTSPQGQYFDSGNGNVLNGGGAGSTELDVTSRRLERVSTRTVEAQYGLNVEPGRRTRQLIGRFVKDVSQIPYARSRRIVFVAYGLKPNTQHYAFFDETPVGEHCARAEIDDFDLENLPTELDADDDNVSRITPWGGRLITDENGILVGMFRIPAGEFVNGENEFLITSVENLETGSDAQISQAAAEYNSSGLAVTKQRATLTTVNPRVTSRRTGERRVTRENRLRFGRGSNTTNVRIDIPPTSYPSSNNSWSEPSGDPGDISDPSDIDSSGSLGGTGPGGTV